ncbi:MAG: acylphosphatase [Candidatus Paceibacterota bacterium]
MRSATDEKEIEASITGKVQGVNFRTFVKKRADELGLTGYVTNLDDGSVEVIAQGEKEQLEELVRQLHKGPHFAEVEEVDVSWHDSLQDTFTDFKIKKIV